VKAIGRLGILAAFLVCASDVRAQGDVPTVYVTADAVAVRFSAPDMGGPAQPRFITRRQLSFEARLYALEEDPQGVLQTRHLRAAIEAHIADEMLAALAKSALGDRAPDAASVSKTVEQLRASLEQRIGGRAALEHACKLDGIDAHEFDALLEKQARAALYIDRAISPILAITEDQLRDTYRTTSHPFRARHFDDCREDLGRWLVLERFRSAEQAYLQTARSRVVIIYS
jgi:hypothetical protein